MDAREAAREFADLYSTIYGLLYRRRDPRAWRPSGETLAMLQHLRDSGPLTVTEAARHFDRSQAAISERIEGLVERGLLDRIQDERDRRRHFVWLTEAGEELLRSEFEVLSSESLTGALQRLPPEERESLIRSTRALRDGAREYARKKREE